MRIFLLFILLAPAMLCSQTHNMQLLSNTKFSDNCSDIWGYVDSTGREYAFVGRYTGTSVFDVTDPTKPVSLQFIPGSVPNSWREIKTYKNRAYVTTERGTDGLLIINMSQAPSKITWTFWRPQIIVNDLTLGISKTVFLNTAHDLIIDEKGICYLHGSNVHQGLVMLDLKKNLDAPEYIGIFNPNYSHGGEIRRDTFWSADILAGEATIWDIKDKSKPKKIANQRTGNAFTHSIALSDDSKYMFTTDERANAYLECYRVDNLSNITFLDRYRSHYTQIRNTIPHNVFFNNGFVFTSYYTDGFIVVDATDPTQLVEVGAYDTYSVGDGDFHGCWGVYPYLPSGNILLSDIENGFFIVKPTYTHASYIKGLVKDSISGIPIPEAVVKIDKVPFYQISSGADGAYKTGGPYSGNVSILVSKAGYESKSLTLNVKTGKVTNTDILLKPLTAASTGQINIKVIDAMSKLPITNAQLRFEKSGESILIKALPEGTQLTIAEGNWTIRAGAWGYQYNSINQNIIGVNQVLTIELKSGYQDNFTFDFGWTASSTATSGIWGRVSPIGTYHVIDKPINPDIDISNDFGDQCMVTGNNATNVSTDDVDGGDTRLVSPSINFANIDKPVLNFYAWTARLNLIDSIASVGNHKVFIVSGGDTILIDTISSNKAAWNYYHFSIDKSKLKNPNACSIIFDAFEPSIADYRNIIEYGIDGFSISDGSITATNNIVQSANLIKAYPNPWTQSITVSSASFTKDRTLQLIDIHGQIIYETTLYKNQNEITIHPQVPAGKYFIYLHSDGTTNQLIKVVKVEK